MSAYRSRAADPGDLRWQTALASTHRVAVACSGWIPGSVCRAMATAMLDDLGAAGYLAPLAGEREQRLTAFLADVGTSLDAKGYRVRGRR